FEHAEKTAAGSVEGCLQGNSAVLTCQCSRELRVWSPANLIEPGVGLQLELGLPELRPQCAASVYRKLNRARLVSQCRHSPVCICDGYTFSKKKGNNTISADDNNRARKMSCRYV